MAKPVEMPRMGYDMTEGKIQRWIKQEGEEVTRGDALAEIETDKVNIEIEAFQSGVLRKIIRQEGETAAVGEIIAVIGEANEEIDLTTLGGAGDAPPAAAPAEKAPAEPSVAAGVQAREQQGANGQAPSEALAGQGEGGEAAPVGGATPSPAGTRRAPAEGPLTLQPRPEGIQRLTGPSQDRLKASPIARRLAEEHGVNLVELTGSGPQGRIIKDDVEQYLRQAPARPAEEAAPAPVAAPVPAPVVAAAGAEEVPLTRMRQTIARRTAESKQQAPHFYLTVEVTMDEALALRQQLNQALETDGVRLSVNDLIVKATAKALVKYRYMNASFAGDKLIIHPAVDIGVAVSMEQGLISPIIRNADIKALSTISQETRDLAGRARAGTLRPEEFSGGTFTISNLGMFNIEEFVAIIVQPQAGILAVGEAVKRPVVRDDQVVVATIMKLTLSADHRVTDGAQAAIFLNEIRRLLEAPMLLLV